jgi:mono/diheme cytochrome c family protein
MEPALMYQIIGNGRALLFCATLFFLVHPLAAEDPASFFDRQVAPLLATHCAECHHDDEPEGELNLLSQATARKGGENGPALVPGDLQKSLLWKRVAADEMPPEDPLGDREKQILKKWIESGADWGTDPIDRFRYTTDKRAGYDWWALQPLQQSRIPSPRRDRRIRNPIDAFLLSRLEQEGLSFSEDTDARSLVRRAYLDFHGLPPTPDEVAQFVANPSEQAYQQLLTRLLDSPRYGERWGRHWLDVVRFGESDGFERNNPRKDFWHYRDWVIEAFNADMPYNEFVRMQVAGDVIKPGTAEGFAAIGFLVAAVHNTVVGGSEMMKRQSRADEIEELVGAIGQTFVGLTVNCARCHAHKFDPISQDEYYQLSAAVAGLNHGTREIQQPGQRQKVEQLQAEQKEVVARLTAIRTRVREQIIKDRSTRETPPIKLPQPLASWEFEENFEDSIGSLHGTPQGGARLENGALVLDGKGAHVITTPITREITEKTLTALVQLDNLDQRGGGAISLETTGGGIFDAIVFGEREPRRWMAGSNVFARTQPFQGTEEKEVTGRPVHFAIVYSKDGTITGYRDGVIYGKSYKTGLQPFPAGGASLLFGLRHSPPGGNRFLAGRVLQAQLFDRALDEEAVAAISGDPGNYVPEKDIVAFLKGEQRAGYLKLKQRQQQLEEQVTKASQAARLVIYTNVPRTPAQTFFLNRGDVMDRGELVVPGTIQAIAGLSGDLGLAMDAGDAERRLALADWLTSEKNSLATRVIVNRLWHYHFGLGIVDTPSDLGFNGSRPTHPELLDWLSQQLIDSEYSLKALHRLIASSTAYRQSSRFRARAAHVDADNRLLWRKSPYRVEGEVVRDSILAVSGQLNLASGGPGFEDVKIEPNNGTTYYRPFDKEDPGLNRRTIYRFSPRGERMALLDVFDCPDPSSAAPRRSPTTTPLQALSLMNNAFVLRMADHLAAGVKEELGEEQVEEQVDRVFQLTLGRVAEKDEKEKAVALVQHHGLALLARTLFNTNEFLVIP